MKNISPLIQLEHVTKVLGSNKIINNVNLTVRTGSIIALLGVNGAGKSTLIKMLLGQLQPTTGKIYLNGLPPHNPKSRLTVGVALQDSQFIEELTVCETLQFVRAHYSNPYPASKIIHDFSLQEIINSRTGVLSAGQKKRLALALAFAGQPKLVFLDEPTAGLDAQSRLNFWKYIKSYQSGDKTVFLTTHYREEIYPLADRIIILNKGQVTEEVKV